MHTNVDNQDTLRENIAQRVRSCAEARRLNASALGDALQIPSSSMANYWSGKRPWPLETLVNVADLLEVSIDELLGRPAQQSVAALPVAVGIEASAGDGSLPLAFDETQAVPFPRQWLRDLGDPKDLSLIRVKGDSMFPKIVHGDWVIFDKSRQGPGDGTYLIRLDGEILVKRVCFFDQEIRVRSENLHWPEIPVPYSSLDDPMLFQIIGRVVWVGRSL